MSEKSRISELEDAMLRLPQCSAPVTHSFGPGTYVREVKLLAGTLAIGHHQNFEHLNIFVKGRVTMISEDGTKTELKAPMVFVGKPGRKIGFIHEDVTWLNVYATDEKNIEKLESHFLTKRVDWSEFEALDKQTKLLQSPTDTDDFEKTLKEIGVTPEKVREQSEQTDDLIDLPYGNFKIKTGHSMIEGTGLFATAPIREGEVIAPARIFGKRTIAGRYTNHAAIPNAEMRVGASNDDIYLVALREIEGCKGGFDGEEITINYRASYELTRRLGESCRVLQQQLG